jgi:formylglycine-generating enzyme required for sulfatase activity
MNKRVLLVVLFTLIVLLIASCRPMTRTRQMDGMTEIYIPAGDFLMGSSTNDTLAESDEFPQHTVRLDAYWIDQHEVTNAQYAKCVAAGVCAPPHQFNSHTLNVYYGLHDYEDHPVLYVDWYEACAYCAWVGGSLPSEAQWEKAARGNDGRLYPWGNTQPEPDYLNYNQIVLDTTRVCAFPEGNSPYGICDLAGNVSEWVTDWYGNTYYTNSPSENPQGPAQGDAKVIRGGNWSYSDAGVRAANRIAAGPDFSNYNIGFRCSRQP